MFWGSRKVLGPPVQWMLGEWSARGYTENGDQGGYNLMLWIVVREERLLGQWKEVWMDIWGRIYRPCLTHHSRDRKIERRCHSTAWRFHASILTRLKLHWVPTPYMRLSRFEARSITNPDRNTLNSSPFSDLSFHRIVHSSGSFIYSLCVN